jgi:hypothetical protein
VRRGPSCSESEGLSRRRCRRETLSSLRGSLVAGSLVAGGDAADAQIGLEGEDLCDGPSFDGAHEERRGADGAVGVHQLEAQVRGAGEGGLEVLPRLVATADRARAYDALGEKEAIAFAQTYFALQTRKAELIERRLLEAERVSARHNLTASEKELSSVIYPADG